MMQADEDYERAYLCETKLYAALTWRDPVDGVREPKENIELVH